MCCDIVAILELTIARNNTHKTRTFALLMGRH
jgi:hypothetical protein